MGGLGSSERSEAEPGVDGRTGVEEVGGRNVDAEDGMDGVGLAGSEKVARAPPETSRFGPAASSSLSSSTVACLDPAIDGGVGGEIGGGIAPTADDGFSSGSFPELSLSLGTSIDGFDKFGSSPALTAFAIRTAWNLATLVLAAISGSGVDQMFVSSRNAAAA